MRRSAGVLLDSTVVVDALRNRNQRRALLAALIDAQRMVAISAITLAEVHAGMRPGEEDATRQLLTDLELFPVSAAIAARAGDLKAELRRRGQTRSITDMIVAATGLELRLSVATDNRKDFQIEGLTLLPLP